ncbi:MAG: TolC family protein [Bacteroidetes bacterium]|nr:TolC family protein [Bacteroidota bacterium]
MIQLTLKQHLGKNPYKWLLLAVTMACITQVHAQTTPVKNSKPGTKTTTTPATQQPSKTSNQPATQQPLYRPITSTSSSSTFSNPRDTGMVVDIREKLVQLALQNPNYEIADRNVAIANYQLRKSKGSWLNTISATGNLNEFSINPPVNANGVQTVNLFPRYNIGVTIPFDLFSTKSNETKIARQQVGIAQAQKNERFREIKADVLSRYEDYLLYKQKLEFQSQIVQDAESAFLTAEKDFSDGVIKQNEYNTAFKTRATEKTMLAEIVHGYNLTKIELEKIIGVPIESVTNNQ